MDNILSFMKVGLIALAFLIMLRFTGGMDTPIEFIIGGFIVIAGIRYFLGFVLDINKAYQDQEKNLKENKE